MSCPDRASQNKKIKLLEDQILLLQRKNNNLSVQLNELLRHPTMAAGIRGEKLIIRIAQGLKSKKNDPHDLTLKDGSKVEVKYSRLSYPNPTKSSTCRWVWNGVTGVRNEKDYDYLVLIGEKDNSEHKFEEDDSPYVFFLLTKDNINQIVAPGGHRGFVFLSIIRNTTRGVCKALWNFKKKADYMHNFFDQLKPI